MTGKESTFSPPNLSDSSEFRDSDYWIRPSGGGFEIGRSGEAAPYKRIDSGADNFKMYSKIRALFDVKAHPSRFPKMIARDVEDLPCHITASFVVFSKYTNLDELYFATPSENIDEKDLKPRKFSYGELYAEVRKKGVPLFVYVFDEKIHAIQGTVGFLHAFAVIDEDPETQDLVCFEKHDEKTPAALSSFRKIFNRYSATGKELLWSPEKA